ncbi:hypothetical protein [uncultured Ruminococcus sp.]|uniref:hypothetical protein n=1 Tax=uncultured Ruminococcus sp. TaxID=165186 RepID=UPI0025EB429C|nr:hypothetical protein [uncultured Ruminococcus sp.]
MLIRRNLFNRLISLMLVVSILLMTVGCSNAPPTPTISDASPQTVTESVEIENVITENELHEFITTEIYLEEIVLAEDKISELLLEEETITEVRKWKNSLDKIIKHELADGNIYHFDKSDAKVIGINTECDKIIYYSLKDADNESYYGLKTEVIDIAYIIRLILESCEPEDEIILDFTYIGDWADDCIPKALMATENEEKTIVLVEGTSDKDILEFAMSSIYPHLSDLFYFMDFDDGHGGKRDGGTSYIIKNLKAFYFSKLKSKFIAIFDNDAEGFQSKCILENEIKKWTDNFRLLLYPQDSLFKSYPTILPNGSICNDDINKKACSIELYLPDSLIKENDDYLPIEWESRKTIKHDKNEEYLYQGVISHKDEIKKRFITMRNGIIAGNQLFVEKDWERIKKILDTIVFAFST